jgi:hypothetical protein
MAAGEALNAKKAARRVMRRGLTHRAAAQTVLYIGHADRGRGRHVLQPPTKFPTLRYRDRGLIQVTGRNNHMKATVFGMSIAVAHEGAARADLVPPTQGTDISHRSELTRRAAANQLITRYSSATIGRR